MEALFARKLARMHVCKIPLSKNCKTLSDKITDRMALYLSESKPKMLSKAKSDKVKQILANVDEEAELNWLKSIFPRIKTRQVLCHGDLNRANILIADENDEPDDKLILIDYEFTSYNFRGLDITSHFSHRTVDVKNFKGAFKSGQDYPTLDERKHFIRAYNDEIRRLGAYKLDEAENGLDNVDEMLMESLFFNLLFSIFSRFLMASDTDKFEAMGFDIFARVEEQEERYSNFKNELSDWLKSKK
ncbi:Choline/ethanolamine kinase [Halotydeus destructor]|nr:Choline/ethanolamine kinase [Halotydeus destructor]